ncbi:hypothetical protein D3C71_1553340 [compost metagenome]
MVQHCQRNLPVRPPDTGEAGGSVSLPARAAPYAAFERHVVIAALIRTGIAGRPHDVLQQTDVGNNLVVVLHAVHRRGSTLVLVRQHVDQIEQRRWPMRYRDGKPVFGYEQRGIHSEVRRLHAIQFAQEGEALRAGQPVALGLLTLADQREQIGLHRFERLPENRPGEQRNFRQQHIAGVVDPGDDG